MYKLKSHDVRATIILSIMLLLSSSYNTFAQCPTTNTVLLPLDASGQGSASISEFFSQPINLLDSAISQQDFDCRDIGIHEILLEGVTVSQKFFSCKELIIVYDSTSNCSDAIQIPEIVSGKILTQIGLPVQGVSVALAADDGTSISKNTNEDGIYSFKEFLNKSYAIKPTKPRDDKNGVTTQDLLIVQKHLLELKKIKSPYQLIAADVNNSKTITAYDMILIRQMILQAIDKFPDNDSWRFIQSNYEFEEYVNPLDSIPTTTYRVDFSPTISVNNNFIAVKIGDLNHSAIANQNQVNKSRTTDIAPLLQVHNKAFQKGEIFTVDITSMQSFEATGFQLGFDMEESVLVLQDIKGIQEKSFNKKGTVLRISHSNIEGLQYEEEQVVLQFTFKAKKQGTLADNFRLTPSSILNNEWYDSTIQAHPLTLHFNTPAPFSVGDNYPNPFSKSTFLPISLPTAGLLQLSIFNLQGKKIWSTQQTLNKGMQEFPITAPFPNSGIYLYQVNYDEENIIGKLHYLAE